MLARGIRGVSPGLHGTTYSLLHTKLRGVEKAFNRPFGLLPWRNELSVETGINPPVTFLPEAAREKLLVFHAFIGLWMTAKNCWFRNNSGTSTINTKSILG